MDRKIIHSFLTIMIIFTVTSNRISGQNEKNKAVDMKNSINDIVVFDMDKNQVPLSSYNGKVLLIVNVASECGNTPQYESLQKIYEKYKDRGFEILAFPCNDFGGQEPGSNEEIKEFCSSNFGVTFKLFDKVKVLGNDGSPLYERLINNDITFKGDVSWNFEKFLISREGDIVARFKPKVKPDSEEIISAVEKELAVK